MEKILRNTLLLFNAKSFGDRNGTLCNKKMAMELLSLTENDFKNEEIVSLNNKILTEIF